MKASLRWIGTYDSAFMIFRDKILLNFSLKGIREQDTNTLTIVVDIRPEVLAFSFFCNYVPVFLTKGVSFCIK